MQVTNISAILLTCSFTASLFGQSGAVVGAGYAFPGPLAVSPGQVITVFASGVGSQLTQQVTASTTPLPTTLAGISVSFTQLGSSQGPIPVRLPLLAVYPVQTCLRIPFSCSTLLGITLQVPFEFPLEIGQQRFPNSGQLVVSDGISISSAFGLRPVPDQVHILRFGDTITPSGREGPVVTHADGSVVSAENPAKVGEEIVMYALGLGATNPAVKTGDPGPLPAATTVTQFILTFDYRPNASASSTLPSPQTDTQQSTPLFAGLVPTMVGLYQINFQVPAPAGRISSCGDVIGDRLVQSNLTVNLFFSSFDGAGICVTNSATLDAMSSRATRHAISESQPMFVPSTIWFPPDAGNPNPGRPATSEASGLPPASHR